MTEDSTSQTDRQDETVDEFGLRAVSHSVPASQPDSVQEIAPPLLSAYTVKDGHVHLVGCHLHRIPVVRIAPANGAAVEEGESAESSSQPGDSAEPSDRPTRYFVFDDDSPRGREADRALLRKLGVANVLPTKRPGAVPLSRVEEVVNLAFEAAGIVPEDESNWQISIVWCKQVEVKLEFTIGEASTELCFEGWAGTLTAPAYHCDVTDFDTFHLAATSDGRIVAAQRLEACEVSGDKLPRNEIVRCTATDKRVASRLTSICPASGLPVQTDWMVPCSMCGQQVSPASLDLGRCAACRRLRSVRADDPRIASVMGKYPELTRWRWLSLAESETALILVASGLWQRRLLVVDRVSGALLRASRGHRGSRDWQPFEDLDGGLDL